MNKLVPDIFGSPIGNAIGLTFLPGLAYTVATTANILLKNYGYALNIIISLIFVTIEYVLRIPIINYSSVDAGLSNTAIQGIWIGVTMLLSWMTDLTGWFT